MLKRGPGGYGRGSVVFCMEELLRRDSALCRLTEGRYGQRDRSMKGGRGLKGKAYLVVGLIPGELFLYVYIRCSCGGLRLR